MNRTKKLALSVAVLLLLGTIIFAVPNADAAWFTQEVTVLEAGYNTTYGYHVVVQNDGGFTITKSFPLDNTNQMLAVALTALSAGRKVEITFNNATLAGGLVADLILLDH